MINLVEDIKPVSYVRSHTTEILKNIERKKNPIVITQNGEAKAVLMDVGRYQNIVDALNLLKVLSIGESDIRNNRAYSHDDIDKEIRALLEDE